MDLPYHVVAGPPVAQVPTRAQNHRLALAPEDAGWRIDSEHCTMDYYAAVAYTDDDPEDTDIIIEILSGRG